MKKLIVLLCLLGVSCSPPTNGKIIGKRISIMEGIIEDTTRYYIKIQGDEGGTNEIQVTKDIWEKATDSMRWPFGDK